MVWIPKFTRYRIMATASREGSPADRDVDITSFPFPVHVHINVSGVQIVTLKSPTFHVVLAVDGPPVTLGPVRLTFCLSRVSGLGAHLDALGAFAHLLIGHKAVPQDVPGRVERIRLRDALIALDGERAGASRREIATVIYGAERVAEEWKEPSGRLKAVIKRDVLRGRRLVAGGYRELVAGGTNRARP